MNIVRKLYEWVLHWAETPYGAAALFGLAFAEASFFPIPPDALLIALVLGMRSRAFHFAFICSLGSVLGAIVGYLLGHFLWWAGPEQFTPLAHFFFTKIPGFNEQRFFQVQHLYENWNFWIVFTAGFTPLPYKVFTITGGAFNVNFWMFLFASLVSRSARFFIVAGLIWKFGKPIRNFLDRHFNWLAVAFTALLIGGFILIKYLM